MIDFDDEMDSIDEEMRDAHLQRIINCDHKRVVVPVDVTACDRCGIEQEWPKEP